jgi:hypothetical protein
MVPAGFLFFKYKFLYSSPHIRTSIPDHTHLPHIKTLHIRVRCLQSHHSLLSPLIVTVPSRPSHCYLPMSPHVLWCGPGPVQHIEIITVHLGSFTPQVMFSTSSSAGSRSSPENPASGVPEGKNKPRDSVTTEWHCVDAPAICAGQEIKAT